MAAARKFLLCTKDATAAQQDAITTWLRSTSIGFWHQFTQLWALVDRNNEVTPESLRNKVKTLAPGLHFIVLEVTGAQDAAWVGWGDNREFQWMRKTWLGDYDWDPSAE